ncbi:hypothetical protein DIPPA_27644 [Diplonema papillatum]|nr:hypothetical protein DIPPA_27644 [Diplonema papillatum]
MGGAANAQPAKADSSPQQDSDGYLLRQIGLVFALYAVQGIPAGFIDNFLPLALYGGSHAGRAAVGWLGLLSFPWLLKFVWAPLVDCYASESFGRKKSWIVPSHLAMLAACAACACLTDGAGGVSLPMVAALLAFTTATAVEDCAVDGYAMNLLAIHKNRLHPEPSSRSSRDDGWQGDDRTNRASSAEDAGVPRTSISERGHAATPPLPLLLLPGTGGSILKPRVVLALLNSAQVVGYRIGHFYAGAPIWRVYGRFGWHGVWAFMFAPILLATVCAAAAREPRPAAAAAAAAGRRRLPAVLRETLGDAARPGFAGLLLFGCFVKTGEKIAMSMYKPYLLDSGYPASDVGTWIGTYGAAASTAASIASSFLVGALPAGKAVRVALVGRAGFFLVSLFADPRLSILAQGAGCGLVTTAIFAYFMDAVSNCSQPLSCFIILQCSDDVSRLLGFAVAGWSVDYFGYATVFACCIPFMLLPLVFIDASPTKMRVD